jgi:hypothetical protein
MPKSLRLNIAEPCHENWQHMTPQEQGRFCGSCQKTVVDFTMLSDQEVLNYFLKTNHNVCGRFANDQLNKDLMVTEKKKRFSWAYIWNVLLATFLLTEANAQVKPKPKKPVKTIVRKEIMGDTVIFPVEPVEAVIPIVVKGKVIDEKNRNPIIGASIRITGRFAGVMADTLGNFRLSVKKKDSLVLEFSAIGYESQKRVINNEANRQDIQIYLKPTFAELKQVSVTRHCYSGLTGTVGSISVGYKITKAEKIKRTINDRVLPAVLKKDIKIYPNPVIRGNSIQVSLALKQAGDYKLEVLNTAGQVMLIQPLLMQTKEQVIDVHTQTIWSAGIYWIRISSPNTKNVYQSKLLVQ